MDGCTPSLYLCLPWLIAQLHKDNRDGVWNCLFPSFFVTCHPLYPSSISFILFVTRFHTINSCWLKAPEERPTFLHLVQEISSILEAEAGYLDLSVSLVWKKQEDTAGDTKPLSEKTTAKENIYDTAM